MLGEGLMQIRKFQIAFVALDERGKGVAGRVVAVGIVVIVVWGFYLRKSGH